MNAHSHSRARNTVIGVISAAFLFSTALLVAAPKKIEIKSVPQHSISMVQGTVKSISGTTITLLTPAHGPGLSHSGRVHAMFLMAGRLITVQTQNATVFTNDGQVTRNISVATGDQVCVAGVFNANRLGRLPTVLIAFGILDLGRSVSL